MPHLRIIWQEAFFLKSNIITRLLSIALLISETLNINTYMEDWNAPFKNNMAGSLFS